MFSFFNGTSSACYESTVSASNSTAAASRAAGNASMYPVRATGRAIGRQVGSLVLPASGYPDDAINAVDQRFASAMNRTNNPYERVEIPVDADVTIVAAVVSPEGAEPNGKVIIRCNGNGEYFQHEGAAMELVNDADHTGARMIGFNYRGVLGSTGLAASGEDLFADLRAVIDYAVHTYGVEYSDIILKGHSLGSGIATCTAAQVFAEGHEIFLWNGRSFRDINAEVKGMLGGVVGTLASPVLSATGWSIDAGAAWNAIPATHKHFICAEKDEVIFRKASLYQKHVDDLMADGVTEEEAHDALAAHMYTTTSRTSHNCGLDELDHADGHTASDAFYQYAERCFHMQIEAKVDADEAEENAEARGCAVM